MQSGEGTWEHANEEKIGVEARGPGAWVPQEGVLLRSALNVGPASPTGDSAWERGLKAGSAASFCSGTSRPIAFLSEPWLQGARGGKRASPSPEMGTNWLMSVPRVDVIRGTRALTSGRYSGRKGGAPGRDHKCLGAYGETVGHDAEKTPVLACQGLTGGRPLSMASCHLPVAFLPVSARGSWGNCPHLLFPRPGSVSYPQREDKN